MTTLGGELNPAASNSSQFQHYSESLFTPSNVEQHHFALRTAQLQQLQSQQQPLLVQQKPSNSSNVSPTPNCFSPDNLTNSFTQSTPEKTALSQSPPSPADSGVVTDAKSEGGNVSQESLQNVDQNKLEDSLDFTSGSKSPITGASFGATNSSTDNQNSFIQFQLDHTLNSATSFNSLNSLKNNYSSDIGLGISTTDDYENSVSIPSNLASIWSPPALSNPEPSLAASNSAVEEAALQAALQQHQLGGWSSNFTGLTNPPPGLGNSTLLQKQLQQQQAMQQLALRRSQSTALSQANMINRSTSYQPGLMGGMGSLNSAKLNGSLNPKQSSYSSWSNGASAAVNQWPSSSRSSLFNSLQHSTSSAGRLLTGSNVFRKPSLGSQMIAPPRLNRSISTPAKYSYMNGSGLAATLDDNPFFKVGDTSSGLTSMTEGPETIGFSNWESQLYDVMRSADNQALGRAAGKWTDLNSDILFEENSYGSIAPGLGGNMTSMLGEYVHDRFSRKVFVGGLPPDIDEEEIQASFRQFGPLVVDWPHKAESKSYFPPKGYAFLLFQEELSVQNLISCCLKDGDKLYLRVSSPTIREKPVQIRPWNLTDSDFVLDRSQPLDPRKTIFVGGVPRPLKAVELAMIMDRLYGGVCYAGIDVDPDLKYPKGAGRVAFSNQQSYIAAISARFVQLQHGDIDKRVEVKPYVLDDQHCDECQGSRCGGKFAPFFCANVVCLQYYCEHCWSVIHARPGREFHKPLVKEGADRSSRSMSYRW